MNTKLKLCTALLIGSGLMTTDIAQAQMTERTSAVALNSLYVPVDLNQLANDKSTFDAPSTKIDFNKIPFNIAEIAATITSSSRTLVGQIGRRIH